MSELTTWRRLIHEAMRITKDTTDIVYTTLSEDDWDREFDRDHPRINGSPFTLWTETHVYFPLCYDGAEWVGSAPRNPCDEALGHQGGG